MSVLIIYTRPGCHLCERAMTLLRPLAGAYSLDLRTENIEADPQLEARYGEAIPVVALDGVEILSWPFSREAARRAIEAR